MGADESEVGVKASHKAGWPVAYVAAQIFNKFSSVEELFQGFMHTNCPYLAPDYAGSQSGRSGQCPGQRQQESYGGFVDRMIGYMRLWFAVAVIQEDLASAWQWMARTLNSQPTPIVSSFLHCALETVGLAVQTRYKRQFVKLMSYLEREYMQEIQALRAKASGEIRQIKGKPVASASLACKF